MTSLHCEQFRRTEEIDNALHFGILIGVGTDRVLELRNSIRDAEHRDEMTSRRGSPHGNAPGVESMFGTMSLDPANRGLAIVDLRGPLRLAGEPVTVRCAGELPAGHEGCDFAATAILVSVLPAAAVDENDHRQEGFFLAFFGEVEVEFLTGIAGAGIVECGYFFDTFRQSRSTLASGARRTIPSDRGVLLAGEKSISVGIGALEVPADRFRQFLAAQFAIAVRVPAVERGSWSLGVEQ
jgi:hypothetical protein